MRRRFRFVIEHGGVARLSVTAGDVEFGFPEIAPEKPDQSGGKNDERKRDFEKEDRNKGQRGDRPHHLILERFSADADDRNGNDRHHRWFQSVKDRGNPRQLPVGGVNETQSPKNEDRGNDKKRPGDDAAPGFVKQPS